MKDWFQFTTFDDYVDWVSKQGKSPFHFKASNYLFSGLGNFFHHFFPEQPSSKINVSTCLGILTDRALTLDASHSYCKPANFLRQGDIIQATEGDGLTKGVISGNPTHWIIVSQTCTVLTDSVSLIAPCYTKKCFIEQVGTIKTGKTSAFWSVVNRNEVSRFILFPAADDLWDEPLVIDIGSIFACSSAALGSLAPEASLTYPALAYLCNRLASHLFRDVKDCDDQRSVGN